MPTLFSQFKALSKKSFILSYRNWKGTLGMLIAPLLLIILLLIFQFIGKSVTSNTNTDPDQIEIGRIEKCIRSPQFDCKTLIYAPSGVGWVENVLRIVASRNGLSFENDFISKKKKTTKKKIINKKKKKKH